MEPRDTVGAVDRFAHELTLEECAEWMDQLEMSWPELLKAADVGTRAEDVRSRWKKDKARQDRLKIRHALVGAEQKKSTEVGRRILGLEEWYRIGLDLSRSPHLFAAKMHELRPLAILAKESHEKRLAAAAADKRLAEAESAFTLPTPDPKRPRK